MVKNQKNYEYVIYRQNLTSF